MLRTRAPRRRNEVPMGGLARTRLPNGGRRWLIALVALSVAMVAAGSAGANPAGRVTNWTILSTPNEEGWNWLQSIDASAPDDAWSVGWYIGSESMDESLALHWDGTTWALVDTPTV